MTMWFTSWSKRKITVIFFPLKIFSFVLIRMKCHKKKTVYINFIFSLYNENTYKTHVKLHTAYGDFSSYPLFLTIYWLVRKLIGICKLQCDDRFISLILYWHYIDKTLCYCIQDHILNYNIMCNWIHCT